MRKSLFSLGILALATVAMGQESYSTSWTGHRTLHVNTLVNSRTSTAITANVTKFPMLVRLGQADSAIFTAAKTGGADVRFTKSDNTTRLQHSIETWDATNRIGAVWVLLDTVYSNNLTQNFRMHWGNASAVDSSKSTAVFDTANGFVAVWHMGNAANAAPRPNSVAGGNAATPRGGPAQLADGFVPRAGLIGMADTLRSSATGNNTDSADHFTLGSGYEFSQGTGTFSLWTKFVATGNWNNMISMSSATAIGGGQTQGGMSNNIWMGRRDNSNDFQTNTSIKALAGNGFFPADSGVEGTARTVVGALSPNNVWAHITMTFSDSGRRRTVYKDGVLLSDFPALASGTRANDSINYRNTIRGITRTQTFIGRSQWGDRNYRGAIDEFRISKVARSADWIALDYASQRLAQTLVADSTAPVIAYGTDSIVAEVGFAIQSRLPTIFSGLPHPTVAISPALPAGLAFSTGNNANRGLISGTPTAAVATTMHVITATNAKGTFTDTIYVTVNANTENYTTWTNIKPLSFTSPASVTVNRFPFLVRLGAADSAVFSGAGTGGASLRFSRTDAVKLKYSIDHWDATARKGAVWVLIDQVTAGANTLRMHWGNGSATSQSSGPSVFEANNGYVAVWHMGNPIGDTLGGSRPNMANPGMNNARPFYATAPVASMIQEGAIGKADSLRGQGNSELGDHFHLDTSAAFSSSFPNGISMSLWVKPTVYPGTSFVQWLTLGNRSTVGACPPCGGAGNGTNSIWMGRIGNANNFVGGEALNGTTSGGRVDGPTGSALLNEWQHFTMTILGTTTNGQKLYRNGLLIAQRSNTAALQTVARNANFLGRATWNDPTSTGLFDEVRVSNVIRDSNWIKLEFESQRPGAGPLSLSYANVSGAPGAPITPRSPIVNSTPTSLYSLSGTLPAGIVFNDTTGVISGTPAGPSSANVTVSVTSGVWSTSAPVSLNFGAVDGAYASAWSGHQFVSINAGDTPVGVSDTLRNFPLLVRLGTADAAVFAASQRKGDDIRFTKLNDITRLQHEIEHWDSAGRSAAIWVKVDTVYGRTNGSRLRMHYGNLAVADSSKASAVFDSANGYLGVWHMGNGTSNTAPRANAVAGGFPATPAASTANLSTGFAPRNGLIGMADSLRGQNSGSNATAKGNDDHFNLGNSGYIFTGGAVTISMWMKLNDPVGTTAYHHFITFGNGTNNADNIWMGRIGDSQTFGQRSATSAGESQSMEVPDALAPLGQWANFTITRGGTDGTTATSFKNGDIIYGPEMTDGTINAVSRAQNYIGRSIWNDPNVPLMVDEVRVQKVTRSAGWVKLEYHNQVPTGTAVVRTTSLVPLTITPVGINQASLAGGQILSFKKLSQGLMFQLRTEVASKARITIVDMHGRTVWNRSVNTTSGVNQIEWNGASNKGTAIGSGIYVVRMALVDANGKTTHSLQRTIPLTR